MEPVRTRLGSPDDFGRMADLMEQAIRTLGPERYTQAQVEAWADAAHDGKRFSGLVHGAHTALVEEGGALVGFGAIQDDGHLTALYVHPDHGRRGIGTTIVAALLAHARTRSMERVHTHASEFSHAVFARAGFQVDAMETVHRNGVALQRRRMSLRVP